MVKPAMVGRMVHGDAANAAITCSKMEQIAQKICIYQIKVVPLQRFSYLNWIYGELSTPRSDCAGCFVVYLA